MSDHESKVYIYVASPCQFNTLPVEQHYLFGFCKQIMSREQCRPSYLYFRASLLHEGGSCQLLVTLFEFVYLLNCVKKR